MMAGFAKPKIATAPAKTAPRPKNAPKQRSAAEQEAAALAVSRAAPFQQPKAAARKRPARTPLVQPKVERRMVTALLPVDLIAELDALASKIGRSRTDLLISASWRFLEDAAREQ
jgi:hypothetical protein